MQHLVDQFHELRLGWRDAEGNLGHNPRDQVILFDEGQDLVVG